MHNADDYYDAFISFQPKKFVLRHHKLYKLHQTKREFFKKFKRCNVTRIDASSFPFSNASTPNTQTHFAVSCYHHYQSLLHIFIFHRVFAFPFFLLSSTTPKDDIKFQSALLFTSSLLVPNHHDHRNILQAAHACIMQGKSTLITFFQPSLHPNPKDLKSFTPARRLSFLFTYYSLHYMFILYAYK